MKNFVVSFVLMVSVCFTSQAQNCSKYYPLKEGAIMEYTNYNEKDKEEGKVKYSVSDVTTNGGVTTAVMHMELFDEKGKSIMSSDYNFTCEGDVVRIDFESLMNNQMMQQFGDAEAEITGTDIELPNNLSVGQDLADANMQMKVSMGGMNMNMTVETINRKVEKKESVTTPAGTFPCYVIYSENKTKMMMANNLMPSRMWLAEDVGVVRQEHYKKNGKLNGYMVLTAFKE